MGARTVTIHVRPVLDAPERDAVVALVTATRQHAGHRPLSDHLWLDLVHDGPSWHAAVLVRADDQLVGYAQVARAPAGWIIELVIDPRWQGRPADDVARAALSAAIDTVAAAGGGRVHWWVSGPQDGADALAASLGLVPGRILHQMRVRLPLDPSARRGPTVLTRPFRIGHDELAWLEVNNAAFAGHGEQGGWDLPTLRLREHEDWFDPEGFLLHERDGRLAAFCWTKLHHDTDPVLGEIYVIAAHPDFHGLGLGLALTVAGLDSIAARGVTVGMLYVDDHNTAAVALYRSLGFVVHRTDRAYVGDVPPAPSAPAPQSVEAP